MDPNKGIPRINKTDISLSAGFNLLLEMSIIAYIGKTIKGITIKIISSGTPIANNGIMVWFFKV